MISVEIQYKPFAFLPWRKHLERKLPARWSEMSPSQILAVPDLQSGKLDDQKLLEIFLCIRKSIARRIDSYQAHCITRNLKYISEAEPVASFMIPEITGLKSPGPRLKGVTFGAFIFGDSFFTSYLNGNKSDLDRFIACFYTGKNGFNDKEIDKSARKITKQDIAIRLAISINYRLIREWLAISYPYCFQKVETNKKVVKTTGWVDVFDKLIENDLGNQEKYLQTPVSTVLRNLNNKIKGNTHGSKV